MLVKKKGRQWGAVVCGGAVTPLSGVWSMHYQISDNGFGWGVWQSL